MNNIPVTIITVDELVQLVEKHCVPSKNHSFMLITYKLWNELMKIESNKELIRKLQNESKGD